MRAPATFGVNQHNDQTIKSTKHNEPLLTIGLSNVLARNSKVVPDGLAADEVEPMSLNVGEALLVVPSDHRYIVVTL